MLFDWPDAEDCLVVPPTSAQAQLDAQIQAYLNSGNAIHQVVAPTVAEIKETYTKAGVDYKDDQPDID